MEDGSVRSRQNVIHEMGYLQALYGRERVVILKEHSVEFFSNNFGVEYIGFAGDAVNAAFHTLQEAPEGIYEDVVEEEREAAEDEDEDEDEG